jgi:cytochrome c oxidase assembly protein subunit 15
MTEATTPPAPPRRQIAAWLLVCCALVFAMVVVGGVTRLTHSGLSMVEWQPIVGTLPPLDDADWEQTFDKYKQTPEFRLVNPTMTLDGFKGIFWWEYFHRLLGRAIGLVFFIPLLYFIARKMVDRPLAWRLAGIFVLGGLQGALGWYMVKSGLVDNPRVSQLRLAAHLGLALLIFAAMFWQAFDLLWPRLAQPAAALQKAARKASALSVLIFIMAMSGALVAGTRAGRVYNTFPKMDGHWIPPEIFALEPWYANFFNNLATVQFDHRLIAWLLAFVVPVYCWRTQRLPISNATRMSLNMLLTLLVLQITLGITTLLAAVPVALGAAHQGGALLFFAAALAVAHFLRAEQKAGQ